MRFVTALALFAASMASTQALAQDVKTQQILMPLDVKQVSKWSTPYEYRIASFAKDESKLGGGALILLLSQDQRKAFVNFQGTTIELSSVQKNLATSCVAGETRQNVYSNGQVRLLLKLKLEPAAEGCLGNGLISVYVDKHTHRYLVKGLSAL
ncbi:hypothetical protein H8K35_13815 [Undibacterium sp. LX40W]|uniref:Uncharacterized protein n=1 Tax=Undibacterium nitidum TaxID=2762298 RepID=A0A923KUR2_9BURK|nr:MULTISPECIES: hypothetical protein [Undibacterium]MBC3882467.1 hypothetical protein [Undibacterium nitidum]MBC3892748.1 hypothetical protein [Undibacterium sp. LX40W]